MDREPVRGRTALTRGAFRARRPARRILLDTPRVRVGEFHCPPGDARWNETNSIGPGHHVVYPTTRVGIDRAAERHVEVDPGRAVFYRPWEPYDRRLADAIGDHCVFVAMDDATLAEIATDVGVPLDHGGALVPRSGPLPAALYVEARSWVRSGTLDRELAEERVLTAVAATLVAATGRAARPHRRSTQRAHRDLAAAARRVLAGDLECALSLSDVAASVGSSPYHLARVFRAQEGRSLHGYRTQLRIQEALERLADPRTTAEAVALDLGFSSPGHLTSTCRRVVGAPPSQIRHRVTVESRRIL